MGLKYGSDLASFEAVPGALSLARVSMLKKLGAFASRSGSISDCRVSTPRSDPSVNHELVSST